MCKEQVLCIEIMLATKIMWSKKQHQKGYITNHNEFD